MAKFAKIGLLLVILFNLYLCAYSVLHNNIAYHTDIARDLLILQEMVDTQKPTLIGPRAGGIDGLFHGPLWPWLNFPAFLLGNGNPVVIGWFWIGLVALSLGITYFTAKKIFTPMTGLLSAVVLSVAWVLYADGMYNPSGAMIVSPLFFYFFYQYLKTTKVKYLLLTFLAIGVLIQFEVAFGGPMLLLMLPVLGVYVFKKKKPAHLLAMAILIIPLSTYILFDVRHDFLQTRAILSSIGEATGNGQLPLSQILQNRFDFFHSSLLIIPYAPLWLYIFTLIVFGYVLVKSYTHKKQPYRQFYFLFAYFYLGYWPLSFYLNGNVQAYHVVPFLPISVIFFVSSYHVIRKELYIVFVCLVLYFNYLNAVNKIKYQEPGWLFSYNLAQNVFNAAPKEFGYFIFSPDEFGYGPRYAFRYTQKQHADKQSALNTKKPATFVVLSPDQNGGGKNREWWIENKVAIKKKPHNVRDYKNGYMVNEYRLTEAEIKIPADPNLVQDLIFR